jgi:SAM-dependent methyltransferase
VSDYTLALSDDELARYRMMAERAQDSEAELWTKAGIVSGATLADVGCGPAMMSVLLAELVGDEGRVIGVERDDKALALAAEVVARSRCANVELRQGTATDTGLEPSSVDVVVMRHVLAHNGGHEADIVSHLAELVRPGGHVYLVDVDLTAIRFRNLQPELADIVQTYADFHAQLGNDPMIGLQLGPLIEGAGLELVDFVGRINMNEAGRGIRPPAWAARQAMLDSGIVDAADIERWGAALDRIDELPDGERPTIYFPSYVAIGRRAG